MSFWSVKVLEIKLGNTPEKSPALPELIKSGYGRGESNAGVIAVTSPGFCLPSVTRGRLSLRSHLLRGQAREGHFGFYWFSDSGITHKDLQYLTHQEKPWTINGFPFARKSLHFLSDTGSVVSSTAVSNKGLWPRPPHGGHGLSSWSWSPPLVQIQHEVV